MRLRERLHTGFVEYFGRQPSEYELNEAERGYRDQQMHDAVLRASGLKAEQLAAAFEADMEEIARGISGLPAKVH